MDNDESKNEIKLPENILNLIGDDTFSFYLNEISFKQHDEFPNLHILNIKTKPIRTNVDIPNHCYVVDLKRLYQFWLEITDRLYKQDSKHALYADVIKTISDARSLPLAPNVGLCPAHEIKCFQYDDGKSSFLLVLTLGAFGPMKEKHLFRTSKLQLPEVWKSLSIHLHLNV